MLIPEIILYNVLNACVKLVVDDYMAATDKTETIINDLFGKDDNGDTLKIGKTFEYLEQSIKLFTKGNEDARKFEVNIGYNLKRSNVPTIHIILPQDSPGRYDMLGFGEGMGPEENNEDSQTSISTRANTYRTTFHLMITSDNTSEVLILYYFFKSMLLFVGDTLEIRGLHNLKISGQDMQLDEKYSPNNIFHRSLTIEFDYQNQVKVRRAKDIASNINFLMCNNLGAEYDETVQNLMIP